MRIIVADAGPLIVFGRTSRLDLLRAVVGEILVPSAVLAECIADGAKPGAFAVQQAVANGLLTKIDQSEILRDPAYLALLDEGERAAICAAQARQCAILIDERLGRMAAKQAGLKVTGSVGVLLYAKELGVIERIAPIIKEWQALQYFLGDKLIANALLKAGE